MSTVLVLLARTVEFHTIATYTGGVPVAAHILIKWPENGRTTVPGTGIFMFGRAVKGINNNNNNNDNNNNNSNNNNNNNENDNDNDNDDDND